MSELPEYDAFISYSRALDGSLAPELQRGVQRFAKPWYRLRALRAFLDDASLSANPGLWTSIEEALGRSRWFVLLASPEAAASRWVGREVEWWLEHRSAQQVLVVLTSGEYAASVPASLRVALGQEPRWVDLRWLRDAGQVDPANPRLRECVADIASAVREVPKDDLVGEHVRQHRRTLRLARGAVTALVLLTVLVLVAAFVALGQRDAAVAQARTATARGLASAAVATLRTDLSLAQTLAAEAYRVEPNGQTRSALFQALTASPQLDRYLSVGGVVSSLAASASGLVVVAGTEDGRVVRLDLAGGRAEQRVSSQPVRAVAVSADGGVVAAASVGSALRWDVAGGTKAFDTPDQHTIALAAVSPSGRSVAFYSSVVADTDAEGASRGFRIVHDGQNVVSREDSSLPLLAMRFVGEGTLLEISHNDWYRRASSTLDVTAVTRGNWAPGNGFTAGVSADGAQVGFSSETETRLWHTSREAFGYNDQDVLLPAGRPSPSAVALTNDGSRSAVADTGTIHVYDLTGFSTGERVRLEGDSETPFVEFLGDDDHLVSASRDRLALWDLNRNTRLGAALPVQVPLACTACPPPSIAVSQGHFAVSGGAELTVGSRALSVDPPSTFGPLVWNSAGDRLFLVTSPEGIGETWEVRDGMRRLSRWQGSVVGENVLAMGVSPDEQRVVTVNEQGDVQVFEGSALGSARTITIGRRLDQFGWPAPRHVAAVSEDTARAAVVTADSVELVDVAAGTRRALPGGAAESVAFTHDALLVQRSGRIEVWDVAGSGQRSAFTTDPSYLPGIAASSAFVTQMRRDRVMVVYSLSGEQVGAVRLAEQVGRHGRIGMTFDGPERVITAMSEADLWAWDLSEEHWVRAACASSGRDLTAEEWQRYVGSAPDDLTCG